jgi:FkbM family methyltransferase
VAHSSVSIHKKRRDHAMRIYLAYFLQHFIYPFFLIRRKKVKKGTYQIQDDILMRIRENTTDAFVVGEVFSVREYEAKGFDIEPADIVVDIGAHIGAFTVYAARRASKGLVLAYEPFPENFVYLQQNKEINNLYNLKIFNKAVTSTGSDVDLFISALNNVCHSLYKFGSTKRAIQIQSTTLKDIFEENKLDKINFLKIDTEGSEFDIILNAPKILLEKIDKMIIEYHDWFSSGLNHYDIKNYLEYCGFEVSIKCSFLGSVLLKAGLLLARKRVQPLARDATQ